jgi:hypothetical protein
MNSAVPEYTSARFGKNAVVGQEVSPVDDGAVDRVTTKIVGDQHISHKVEESNDGDEDE